MPLFDATLKCPACGGRNLHFSSLTVRVAPEDDYWIVEYVFPGKLERGAGELGDVSPGPPKVSQCRGGGFEVLYNCEDCLHRWGVRQDFHKGNIYSTTMVDDQSTPSTVDEGGGDV